MGKWIVNAGWPYVNSVPHLGTFIHLLYADVYTRYLRLKVEEVPLLHRSTQGVRLIELDPDEKLVGVARAERETEEKDNGLPPEDETEEAESELEFDASDQEDVT